MREHLILPVKQPAEWNAADYHRVANPHVRWGANVIDTIELAGNETVLDAGCGTGRVTVQLLERLPRGRVIAVDRSRNMLEQAESAMPGVFRSRVTFVQADLATITLAAIEEAVDLIFSTATFHWIHDHPRLFANLYALLKPDGWLVAQCGGGPNLAALLQRADDILASEPFTPWFTGWTGPWAYADDVTTVARLRQAGFVDVDTSLVEAPTTLGSATEYHDFLSTVVFGEHRLRLPDPTLQQEFIDRLTAAAASDPIPYHLDYWRLNLRGRRPSE